MLFGQKKQATITLLSTSTVNHVYAYRHTDLCNMWSVSEADGKRLFHIALNAKQGDYGQDWKRIKGECVQAGVSLTHNHAQYITMLWVALEKQENGAVYS